MKRVICNLVGILLVYIIYIFHRLFHLFLALYIIYLLNFIKIVTALIKKSSEDLNITVIHLDTKIVLINVYRRI